MSKPKLALNPKHPERICWGCDKYCSADDLRCGNGTIRTQHPVELFGGTIGWNRNSTVMIRSFAKRCSIYQRLRTVFRGMKISRDWPHQIIGIAAIEVCG